MQSSTGRRLSPAGLASKLKNKALIEPRPPFTRFSFSDRSIFDPDSSIDSNFLHSTPLQRKRRMSSDSESGGDRKKGKQQDQASLLQEIKALNQGSEERTVGRIDERIDKLSDNLTRSLDSNERDVKKLGRNIKELKGDLIALQTRVNSDREGLHPPLLKPVTRRPKVTWRPVGL